MIGSVIPRRIREACCLALALVVLLASAGSASGEAPGPVVYPGYVPPLELREYPGNLRLGPIGVHPGVTFSETYSDNIFLTSKDEEEDFLSVVSPSIALQLPLQRHTFQLEHRTDIVRYGEHERYHTEEFYTQALADLLFGRALTLKLGDTFLRSSTPPDFEGDRREEFNHNALTAFANYRFGRRYMFEAGYTYSVKDFDRSEAELDNFREHAVSAALHYRFLPKTWALIEYYFSRVDNEDKGGLSTDNDNHRVWLGLRWEPTAKIQGTVKGGVITRDYDEIDEDRNSFGMRANLTYSLTSRTTLDIYASRELIQTEFTREEQFFGVDYFRTGGGALLKHKISPKVYGVIEGSFFNDNYNDEGLAGREREDDRFSLGLGLEYHIRDWLALALRYRYADNDSNISIEDYQENLALISLSMTF